MIENFIEYMWYLLTTPLRKLKKALNKWYIFCRVFGRRFDEAKEDILRARDEGIVATCSHEMLPVHGADRRLTIYEGEHPENYRSRIAMYEELCKLGGTNEGILLGIKTLGYAFCKVIRANDLEGVSDRWAEFYVVITMHVDEKHPISLHILQKVVRMWKEVGAKDNYLFRYMVEAKEESSARLISVCYKVYLYYFEFLRLDGLWKLNGSHALDTTGKMEYTASQKYHITARHTGGYNVNRHEWHNLNFLDGTWNLDGALTMDAWHIVEVL